MLKVANNHNKLQFGIFICYCTCSHACNWKDMHSLSTSWTWSYLQAFLSPSYIASYPLRHQDQHPFHWWVQLVRLESRSLSHLQRGWCCQWHCRTLQEDWWKPCRRSNHYKFKYAIIRIAWTALPGKIFRIKGPKWEFATLLGVNDKSILFEGCRFKSSSIGFEIR